MSELEALCRNLQGIVGSIGKVSDDLRTRPARLRLLADQTEALGRKAESREARAIADRLRIAASAMTSVSKSLDEAAMRGRAYVAKNLGLAGGSPSSRFGEATPGRVSVTEGDRKQGSGLGLPDDDVAAGVHYADSSARNIAPSSIVLGTAKQGNLGDCFLIASICAVSRDSPSRLRGMVELTESGQVTVHARDNVGLENSIPSGGGGGNNTAGDIYGYSDDGSTLVPLIEKAYAKQIGGYQALANGGDPADALRWLTGQSARTRPISELADVEITRLAKGGSYAVASTRIVGPTDPRKAIESLYRVHGGHAYTVAGIDSTGRILLHNPWGFDHPEPMPLPEFRVLFPWLSFC